MKRFPISWNGLVVVGLVSLLHWSPEALAADTTPPTVTITYPVDGGTVPAAGFTFQGTASDNVGVALVRITVYDYATDTFPVSDGQASYTPATGVWTFAVLPQHLTPGAYSQLTVTVLDAQGNGTGAGVLVMVQGVPGDTTAPTTPVVIDDGQYTTSSTQLHAAWASADPESGIAEYQYQIRRGSCAGVLVIDWTSTGTATSVTHTNFSIGIGKERITGLFNGSTYYFAVKAKNGAGLWSAVGCSDGIRVDKPPTVSAIGVTGITATGATLNWTTNEAASCIVRCGTSAPPSTQCATTPSGTTHSTTLSNLSGSTTYHVSVTCTDANGSPSAASTTSFTTAAAEQVPAQPSVITINGRQLLLQRRNPDGTLAPAVAYTIRGVTWSPASRNTNTSIADIQNVQKRRPEFGKWYQTDIPLLKAMNVNTVRLFMDPGLPGDVDPATGNPLVDGRLILDECYRNGIMVIMTVDNGNNTVERIQLVVDYYKTHPAVLMWSLGSEWNINRFWKTSQFPTVDSAAQAVESAAQSVKQRDTGHPVVSSYGTIVNKPNSWEQYVTQTCPSIDVWSFNEYRGPGLSRFFDQWLFESGKPMFLGEYGIDAYNSTTQAEDQATHAQWVGQLWDELARNLSANSPGNATLGGTVFEWNDEWWKAGTAGVQDIGGWNPPAFPDGTASEDWWGVVTIDRMVRQLYGALTTRFGVGYQPPAPAQSVTYRAISHYPVLARLWENGALMYEGVGASIDGGRGFNVAAIDLASGRLRDPIQRFDTWGSRHGVPDPNINQLSQLINYLNGLPDGTLLLMAVGDEAGLNNFDSCSLLNQFENPFVQPALQLLESLGSTQIRQYCYRDQWAMIAIKGQGVALSEALGRNDDRTDASTQATFQLP